MTTVTTEVVAPLLGTPEHDAAMAALHDKRTADAAAAGAPAVPAVAPVKPTKPEAVPDKFWNAEKGEVDYAAWSKSTSELEKKLSQGKAPDPAADAAAKAAADAAAAADPAKAAADKAAADALKAKGLDLSAFNAEFAENGVLSPESYATLEAAGIDRGTVDSYIEGKQAIAANYNAAAYAVVGGEENYAKEIAWATVNMTPAEKTAFNTATTSGDVEQLKLAVAGLHQAFVKANGSEPQLLNGNGTNLAPVGFRSRAEQTAAINKTDERGRQLYAIDSAYRADVEKRMALASF